MSFSGYRDAAAGVRRGHAGGVPSVIRPRAHGSRRSCEPRLRVGRSCRGEYGRPVGGGDGGWLTAPMGGQPLRSQVVRRAEVGCGDRRGAWLLLGSTVDRRVWSRYCRARGRSSCATGSGRRGGTGPRAPPVLMGRGLKGVGLRARDPSPGRLPNYETLTARPSRSSISRAISFQLLKCSSMAATARSGSRSRTASRMGMWLAFIRSMRSGSRRIL